MKLITIKDNCISVGCNITSVSVIIFKNNIQILSSSSISLSDSLVGITGISGTYKEIAIDDNIHFGDIRIEWVILNDCGEKIKAKKDICIEQCIDCNNCIVGNFALEYEDIECVKPDDILLETEEIECPTPLNVYLSSTTDQCESALGSESYTVKTTANDSCDDFLVNKIDIVSKELATNVSKNVVTSLGCEKVELGIPKGKWVTIVNDDLSKIEIEITLSLDGGVSFNNYQFLMSNIPAALSTVFQNANYFRKYYSDLYNKIGTLNVYFGFLNVNSNILVKNFSIDFLNAFPYQSVGNDYSTFVGYGDSSTDVFNFSAVSQNTTNLTLNNFSDFISDSRVLSNNFKVSGQITYQIK